MYPNEAIEKARLQAVEAARIQYINHDISHCNIEELQLKCTTCRRYIAHLQISEQYEKFKDRLYSYLSDPLESCVEKNYQYYSDIKK